MRALLLLLVATAVLGLGSTKARQQTICPGKPALSCDVGVAKSGPSEMIIGSSIDIQYQINIPNAGPDAASNVVMTDIVPAPLVVNSVSGNYSNGTISCSRDPVNGNKVVCTLPTLFGGDAARVYINVTIPANAAPGAVSNTARVVSDTCDNDLTNNQNSANSTIKLSADLFIDITGPSFSQAGQSGLFNDSIVVQNLGSSDAQSVVATYFIPAPLRYVSYTSSAGVCSFANDTRLVTCQLGTLVKGAIVNIQVFSLIPSDTLPAGGVSVIFQANVTSTTFDPNLANNVDTHTLQIQVVSNLAVTKSGPPQLTAGVPTAANPAFYSIVVDNSGGANYFDAQGVVVFDQIPSVFQLLSAKITCNRTTVKRENVPCNRTLACDVNPPGRNNYLRCTSDFLSSTERLLIVAAFSVDPCTLPADIVNNTAYVSSQTANSAESRPQDSHITKIVVDSDVVVTKVGPSSIIVSGDNVTYSYTITTINNGPSCARNVTLVDLVPAPLVLTGDWIPVAPIKADATCSRNGNLISCSFGDLTVGQSVTFKYQFTVPADAKTLGGIKNCANATLSNFDRNPDNNIGCYTVQVVAAPDVQVVKTGPVNITVDATEATYYYNIEVKNNGPSNAENVYMTDTIPGPFVVRGPVVPSRGTCNVVGNALNCTIGTMVPLETVTYSVPFYVPRNSSGNTVENIARIFHSTPDTNVTNNESKWPVILIRLADVQVFKAGPSVICAGAASQNFVITVVNNGPADAQGITLSDTLVNDFLFSGANSGDIQISGNSQPASCNFTGQTLFCSLGGLAFGGRITVTFPFRVLASTPARLQVPNTANISSIGNDPNPGNNQVTIFTDICNNAPLTISKVGPVSVLAGNTGSYLYTLVGTNPNGPSDATNVVVTDTIPSQFTYVPGSISTNNGGQCNVPDNVHITCNYARLASGASVTITFSFTVDAGVTAQTVQNCATLSSATAPTTSTNPVTACFNTTVNVSADVSIAKSSDTGACAGDKQTWYYTVSVRNQGPSRARNINVQDTIPALLTPGSNGLISVTGAQPGFSCAYTGSTLNCFLGELAVNGTITVRFPFSVDASVYQQTVVNTATVTSSADQVSSNNNATANTPICNQVDLVQRKAGPISVSAGNDAPYTYTLTVSNKGPSDAVNVTTTDAIPTQWRVVGNPIPTGAAQCTYLVFGAQTTLSCTWPRLTPNQSEQVQVQFTVPANTPAVPVRNCATANSTLYIDLNPADNTACIDTPVDVTQDLSVTKQGPATICASFGGTFTLTVTNNGPAIAFNTNLTDTLPIEFTPVINSPAIFNNETAASCGFAGQVLTCQLGQVSKGRVITITYSVTVDKSVRANPIGVVNRVVVNSTTQDSTPLNNQAEHRTFICAQTDIATTKAAPVEAVAGLGGYVYTLTITNNGPADASGVSLVDTVPVPFVPGAITNSGTGGCNFDSATNRILTCVWAGLFRVNQSETISFLFSVPDSAAAGQVNNCVDVSSTTEDRNTTNNHACAPTNVVTRANLAVSKVGPNSLCAGDDVATFTATLTNIGPSVARTVVLTDSLPSGMTAVAAPAIVVGGVGAPASSVCSYDFTVGTATPNKLTCNFGSVPVNAVWTVTFPFRVFSNVLAANVTNVVSVVSSTQDSDNTNNNGNWPVQIRNCVNLSIVKTGPAQPVIAGEPTVQVFTLTAANDGPSDARNVVVSDNSLLAIDVTILTVQSTFGAQCNVTSNNLLPPSNLIVCRYPVLPAKASDVITIRFTSPSSALPGQRINCGLIASDTPDVNPNTGKQSCVNFTIQSTARLVTTKTGASVIYAGENLNNQVYFVTVQNTGGSDARDAQVVDVVPSIFTVTNVTSSVGTCSLLANTVTCRFGTLAPNATATVTYTYTTKPDAALGKVRNTACANTTTSQISTDRNCAFWDTEVRCKTALGVSKSHNVTGAGIVGGSSQVGAYTIVVTNAGPSTSVDTQVTDTWPAVLSYYPSFALATRVSQGSACSQTATGFFCNLGVVQPGANATVVVTFNVPANVQVLSATNQACAKNSCVDSVCTASTVPITTRADFNIVKDDCVSQVLAGNALPYTFTIRATNNGPSDARNVVVVDTWPSPYARGTVTAVGGRCDLNVNGTANFACFWDSVPAGASVTITVSYTVADSVLPGYATNCVIVTSDTVELNTADNQDCDTNEIITLADLDIRKTIDSDVCVVAGSPASRQYTLTVTNLGRSVARNVVVTEAFPSDLTLLPGGSPAVCTRVSPNANFTCVLGDMLVNAVVQLRFSFQVDAAHPPGIVRNYASVTSSTRDPDLCNNNASVSSLICVESDLGVTKDDGVVDVTAGDNVTYTYTIRGTNYGPSVAPTVVFTDRWPAGWTAVTLASISAPNATCVINSVGFTCTLAKGLKVQESYQFTVTYKVPACLDACLVCNTVSISSPDSPDRFTTNNVATDCNNVRTEADVAVCKTDNYVQVTAGDQIVRTYTVVVTNNGPSCAQKVRLVDHFPAQVARSGQPAVTTQGSCIDVLGSNDFSCNLLTLQPGQSVTVLANYTVPSTVTSCSVTNVAVVSSVTFDPALCNNDAKDVNALVEDARLTITKSDDTGATIDSTDYQPHFYTITYKNLGPSVARDVVLTDRWPGMFVQFAQGITATNGTRCVSTGGDFTCSSGDLAVGQQVVVTVRYSLMKNTPCGTVITNRASVFSPTDVECRSASDSTTVVNCLSPVQICLTCIQIATANGQCASKFAACQQNAVCSSCYNSIVANPTSPNATCFSDPQSCAMLACVYNDACGVGRGGACDSPNEGPVLCPVTKREARDAMSTTVTAAATAAVRPAVPAGRVLAPKMMDVSATLNAASHALEVVLSNPHRKELTVQDVEVQLTLKNGATQTVSLTENGASVQETTCHVEHVKLAQKWTFKCGAKLAVNSADVKSIKVVARGYTEAAGGYHPVVGYKNL